MNARTTARSWKTASAAVALLAATAAPTIAHAYCADIDRGDDFDESIPVYVTTGGPRDVSLLGLTDTQVIDAVISQLEIYNHSAAAVPHMYFAGTLSEDTVDWANVPARAITVMSSGDGNCNQCGPTNPTACWQSSGDKHRVVVRKPGCAGTGILAVDTLVGTIDLFSVLLHELGHAVGLDHPDLACPASYQQSAGTYGIMRSSLVPTSAARRLRRDDILGLMAIYGMRARTFGVRESTNGGASWSAAAPIVPGLATRAPVRASSASSASINPIRAVAFSEYNWGSVGVITGGYNGWDDDSSFDIVDGGSIVDGVSVAVGRDGAGTRKVMAAWFANESVTQEAGNLRWGLKTYTGAWGGWSLHDGPDQESKIVGLGFDDAHRHFLVSTVDIYQRPVVHAVDPGTGAIVATTLFNAIQPGVIRDTVGNAVCYQHGVKARCVIPFTSSTTGGPCMGWYVLSPNADGTLALVDTVIDYNSLSHGPDVYFAGDPRASGSYGFLTNHEFAATSFIPWNRADTIPRNGVGGGVLPPPVSSVLEVNTWPLGVGSIAKSSHIGGTSVKYEVFVSSEP